MVRTGSATPHRRSRIRWWRHPGTVVFAAVGTVPHRSYRRDQVPPARDDAVAMAITVAFAASVATTFDRSISTSGGSWRPDHVMLFGHWMEMRAVDQARALSPPLPTCCRTRPAVGGRQAECSDQLAGARIVLVRPRRYRRTGSSSRALPPWTIHDHRRGDPVPRRRAGRRGDVATDSAIRCRSAVGEDTALAGSASSVRPSSRGPGRVPPTGQPPSSSTWRALP